jgi:hypothetical protein
MLTVGGRDQGPARRSVGIEKALAQPRERDEQLFRPGTGVVDSRLTGSGILPVNGRGTAR